MSAHSLLAEATAAGVVLGAEAGHLRWRADAPPSPALLGRLREHKAEIIALLADKAGANEPPVVSARELDPDLPAEVAAGIDRVLRADAARGVPTPHWPRVQRNVRILVERGNVSTALRHGWDAVDLFGCDRRAPWHRLDRMGLVLLLGDCEVAGIHAEGADLRSESGSVLRFRRRPTQMPPPVLLWELVGTLHSEGHPSPPRSRLVPARAPLTDREVGA